MSILLKQSTVSVINFGPMLDKTDGVTLEEGAGIITSLDHATTGIKLSKNGGTLTIREQGANFVATTYDAHGCYKVSLSAVDTGTLGRLRVIHTEPATYLAVWHDFMIIPANVYNSLILGSASDYLDVAVVEQANIDFGALQKTSLNAATPASVQNIPATGTGLTAIPWNAAWDAEVQSEAQDAITASALATAANLATVAGYLDTEIAAILADTNELQTDDYPTSIAAVKTVVDLIEDIIRNKMAITDANGNIILYEDDSTTAKFTVAGLITDNATTTIRLRLA